MSNIAVVLSDWLEEVSRFQSSITTKALVLEKIGSVVNRRLAQSKPGQEETMKVYEDIQHRLQLEIDANDRLLL